MGNTTLLFLIKKNGGQVTHICLAMKKRSFGVGRWNGVGGKLLPGESIEGALKRETEEEIGVLVSNDDLLKVAEIDFAFTHMPQWNQTVHVYFCEHWENDPKESEEMAPKWFSADGLPFGEMWPSDIYWLPRITRGESVKGKIVFGEADIVLEQNIEVVESF